MLFCQICIKNFARNLKKFRLEIEENIEENFPFSKKVFFMKTLLWTRSCSSENRAQKIRTKNPNGFCSKSGNDFKKLCLIDIFQSKLFEWTHKMQVWRNWQNFKPRVQNNLNWSHKIVKAFYISLKQNFSQFVPLSQL